MIDGPGFHEWTQTSDEPLDARDLVMPAIGLRETDGFVVTFTCDHGDMTIRAEGEGTIRIEAYCAKGCRLI